MRLWKIIKLIFKGIGYIFDLVEPYAIALDDVIAWSLTAVSGIMGLAMISAGGTSLAVLGMGWLLVGYLLCPKMGWGNWEKGGACAIALLLLTIMEKAAS